MNSLSEHASRNSLKYSESETYTDMMETVLSKLQKQILFLFHFIVLNEWK